MLDTPNPSSPICLCGSPIPRIGLSLGVWEPARLMDVTRNPWCFPNLGGLTIDPGLHAARGRTGSSGGDGAKGSVWHAHYYMYPLLSWIGVLLDLGCLEGGGLDIAWTSELDPAWLDDELSFLLNPEAALFANLPAQAACAADCAAASAGLPLDPMFWCAGCQGRDVPADRQRGGPCRRGAGLAAGRPAAGLSAAPGGDRLGHLGIAGALRTLPDADHEEEPVPLADDRAGAGDEPDDRLQPDRAVVGALGDAAGGAGRGRELWLPALEKTDVLSPLNRTSSRRAGAVVAGLIGILLLAACCRPALAQQPSASPEASARDLAEEVLRKAGEDDLGDWTRSILDRALDRAGDRARLSVPGSGSGAGPGRGGQSAPLPAERHAGELTGPRSGTAEILILTSLSVPAPSWRQWARDAARIGAPLVLRGVAEEGLRATVKRIGKRLGGAEAGIAIDPRLFRLFGVTRVPAVVVVPGGVPPCESRGCADDAAPLHDRIAGNIGLIAALEAVADEGAVGRDVARRQLERLRREGQP